MSHSLHSLLLAANHILDTNVDIHARLVRYHQEIGENPPDTADLSPTALQQDTARCALQLIHRVQLLLDTQDPPVIGTRDLSTLNALLTLLFQWGINPLLARLAPLWRTNRTLIDLSTSLADLTALSTLLSDLMSTLFPHGVRAQPPQTLITTTVLNKHVPDLLKASVAIAWLPKSLSPQKDLSFHALRPSVLRLLELCVYMRYIYPRMILNLVVKSPPVPDHDRSRRSIVEHTPAPAPCPQIMFVLAHKKSTSSCRYPSTLCRSLW